MLFGAFAAWALLSFVGTFQPLLNTTNVYIGTAAVGAAFALIVYAAASMLPKRRFVTRREKLGCGCASAGAGCTFALFISGSMAVAVAGSFAITTTSQAIAFFSAFCGLGALGGLLLLRFRDAALRDRELELARDLQQRLLPPPLLETNCCRVMARNVPAAYVAGDFYDFLPLGDDRLLIVVADVAGKGVAAGLISASAKAIVPIIAAQEIGVDRLLSAINERLAPQLARREFVAMVVALFDGATGELSIANAGMPDPIAIGGGRGQTLVVTGARYPLGIRRDIRYDVLRHRLNPGERVLFVTDGLPEQMGSYDVFTRVATESGGDLNALFGAVGKEPQSDDWTAVVLERVM
jgi:hypothetical protein